MELKLGQKYQYYIGDEMKVGRITKFKNEDTVVITDKDSGETSIMSKKELEDMVLLTPDADLNIMTTIDENFQDSLDVYACVNKNDGGESYLPCVVLRQNTYSAYKNAVRLNPGSYQDIYVGDCFCDKNYPSQDTGLKEMLEFTKIKDSLSVSIYIDDKLEDIIKIIGKKSKVFDDTLKEIHDTQMKATGGTVKGYCTTLKQLFKENFFIFNYRMAFNIIPLDFEIELEDGLNSKDGEIFFNSKQQKLFEDFIRKYVKDIKVLKYDNDIDISKIVSHTHMVVSDKNENIYIIAYVVVGDYPVDSDIAEAMKVNSEATH